MQSSRFKCWELNKTPTPSPKPREQEWNCWVLYTSTLSLLLLKKILLSYSPRFAAAVPMMNYDPFGLLLEVIWHKIIHCLMSDICLDSLPTPYWLDRLWRVIHLFNKYFLSTNYVTGTILATRALKTKQNKPKQKIANFIKLTSLGEKDRQNKWLCHKVMLPKERDMEFQKAAASYGEPPREGISRERTWKKGERDLRISEGRMFRQK